MKEAIDFDKVADIYDLYVKVDFDIPFFLKATEGYPGEILELMCGTGRVSIPLLEAGHHMTCVDYSKGMLETFRGKITNCNYNINLMEADATKLNLNQKFGMILLPFHSLTEIVSAEKQQKTLEVIASHLEKNGTFILTLQNPQKRLLLADGTTKILGKFPIDGNRDMIISYMNSFNPDNGIVSGFQFYEIYDARNIMVERRYLEMNFKPIEDLELRAMIAKTDLEIVEVYGDYSFNVFDNTTSDFMIYKMTKK